MQDNKEEMQQEQEYLTQTPSIQWFPGHMAKTRRVMKESLGLVDIVVELRDARIPKSSRNPEIEKIIGDKPRLVVFNKADIADPAVTKQWQEYYKSHGVRTLALDCRSGRGLKELVPAVREVLADLLAKRKAKGMQSRPIRMMIVGVPNVGKSSLINRLAGSKRVKVEDRPGVTRGKQWVRLESGWICRVFCGRNLMTSRWENALPTPEPSRTTYTIWSGWQCAFWTCCAAAIQSCCRSALRSPSRSMRDWSRLICWSWWAKSAA